MRKKIRASFMIFLILFIPFYSSSVLAHDIEKAEVFGVDNIEGFRRQRDLTYVSATIIKDQEKELNARDVFFNDMRFSTCIDHQDKIKCLIGIELNTMEPKTYSYKVSVREEGEEISSYNGVYVVDAEPPKIESVETHPKIIAPGEFTLKYTIADYAYGNKPGSGIKRIVIFKDDLSKSENIAKEITFDERVYRHSGEAALNTQSFKSDSGPPRVCIAAYDNLKQYSGMRCIFLNIDETPPNILKETLKITDSDGNEIGYIPPEPLKIDISIDIEEISIDKVTADLSQLNPDAQGYSNRAAECSEKSPGIWACTWKGIVLNLRDSGDVNIVVKAADVAGNEAEETISYTFDLDNHPPVVLSIESDKGEYEGNKYLGIRNDIILRIEERGSGLNKGNFWILVGNNKIRADRCVEQDQSWVCRWDNLVLRGLRGDSLRINVAYESRDDVGNFIDPERSITSQEFLLDLHPPRLTEKIQIKSIRDEREYAEDEILAGDRLHIRAVLSEKTSLEAFADLSAIGFGTKEEGSCTRNETTYICEWQTDEIKLGPVDSSLRFEFIDFVGNTLSTSVPIKVLGVYEGESPNFWEIASYDKMPEAIDRQTTELISHKSFVHVFLKPRNPSARIESIDLQCDGHMNYIQDYSLTNTQGNDPYIEITLNQMRMPNSSLSLECSFYIISRVGNYITRHPEIEKLDFTIDFYNMPLGELSQSVRKKIEDAQDSWLVKQEWLDAAQGILKIAETICSLQGIWNQFNQVVAGVQQLVGDAPAAQGIRSFLEGSQSSYVEFFGDENHFCKYISCDITIWGQWYSDFQSERTPESFRELGFSSGVFWPSSPKDSIVLSLATGCIPGIIKNLQKMRQVECYYILCLKQASEENIPLYVCDEQKAYLECKLVYGEIFQIVPFASFFKSLTTNFQTIVYDPIGMIFGGLNFYCAYEPTASSHAVCVLANLVPTLVSITDDITALFESETWEVNDGFCEEALKKLPEPSGWAAAPDLEKQEDDDTF